MCQPGKRRSATKKKALAKNPLGPAVKATHVVTNPLRVVLKVTHVLTNPLRVVVKVTHLVTNPLRGSKSDTYSDKPWQFALDSNTMTGLDSNTMTAPKHYVQYGTTTPFHNEKPQSKQSTDIIDQNNQSTSSIETIN